LFHAVVLAGAAFGASSCRSRALVAGSDAGAVTDARDARGADVAVDARPASDAATSDVFTIEALPLPEPPPDAGCDAVIDCGPEGRVVNCQCMIMIA
jgi:hypothetical protein